MVLMLFTTGAVRGPARGCRVLLLALALLVAVLMPVFNSAYAAQALGSKNLTRQQASAVFDGNENYALIVGVDRYDEIANLRYAVADAKALGAYFKSQGYDTEVLLNDRARRKLILKKLRDMAELAGDGSGDSGNVVFAFSGHGFRADEQNYLATVQTELGDIRGTGLALSAVQTILRDAKVRQRVLLIDACRDDPERPTKGVLGKRGSFVTDQDAEGVAVLYSTGADRRSWEDSNLGQGVFTHYLLKGLEGGAADPEGLITFDGLQHYVRNRVKNHVREHFRAVQVPYIGGERSGEFVLAKVAAREEPVLPAIALVKPVPQPVPEPVPEPVPVPEPAPIAMGRLWVNAEPSDAQVRIMNISPSYRDGIELEMGKRFDVLVTKSGFNPWRQWFELSDKRKTLNVQLQKSMRYSFEPDMVEVPTGKFRMGCVKGDNLCEKSETPSQLVEVESFLIAETETTFDQFDAFAKSTGRQLPEDRGWGRGNRPVINVTWEDAVDYAKWLSEKTGKVYRLPSEKEWEYVARAAGHTRYSWGVEIGTGNANCLDCGSRWDQMKTAPVKSFSANAWGVFDMHGNVWEWVSDVWKENFQIGAAVKPGRRVFKGGSWRNESRYLRASTRFHYGADSRDYYTGFRVVLGK